jgi:LCP family protein required for cell wall assembly
MKIFKLKLSNRQKYTVVLCTLMLLSALVFLGVTARGVHVGDDEGTLHLDALSESAQSAAPVLHETPVIEPPAPLASEEPEELTEGRMTVLALGVDARNKTLIGRSDAILLVSIDRKNSRLDLVSVPRDAYVQIGDTGKYDKITHAYAHGGVNSSKRTVENLFGVPIDHYVVFNFDALIGLVDAVGGIEIDVPFAFTEQDSRDRQGAIRLEKGLQTLDGEQALAYARMRKADPTGDIGRGGRQQEVVLALLKKLKEDATLVDLIECFNVLRKNISTDVSVLDLPDLYPYLQTYESVTSHTLKGKGTTIDGIYYYKLDDAHLDEVRTMLRS